MRRKHEDSNGFDQWGGYMEMKKQKLQEQFIKDAALYQDEKDELFKGISVFVNGYSDPPADEIRNLMIQHGGIYHHYYRSGKTTYVIASNLPDCKIKQTQGIKFVKPAWIVDCIKEKKILDYRDYLLYTNQSKSQPSIKSLLSPQKEDSKIAKTASDERFLSEFYSNSRLHHISTMGSIFKQYVNELRLAKDHKFSGINELKVFSRLTENQELDLQEAIRSKVIMHIDMDCFFVSVGIRNRPELKGVPIAVTHAKGNRPQPNGNVKKELEAYQSRGRGLSIDKDKINEMDSMAEIASCSYEARAAGVKNGMFLGQALKLCPSLKPIPYDFESYKEVSFDLYNTVARYTLDIEAVSCDEMYVDCTELLRSTKMSPLQFAQILRDEVKGKTKCPCSIGLGENRLQARIATKKAKPDGQFHLQDDPETFFQNIPVSDLPGVGYSTSYKLKSFGIRSCGDLQKLTLEKLQNEFGNKLGMTLFNHCRGIDEKELIFNQVRKSVSADVNYGIRFQNDSERDVFLKQLSEEVSQRVQTIKMKGKCVTLKLMVRSKDAPEETAKYLGHGVCDTITKSTSVTNAISDAPSIYREVLKIISKLDINAKDLRGIGIQLTRLESIVDNKNSALMKFLEGSSKKETGDKVVPSKKKEISSSSLIKNSSKRHSVLDISLSQVDQSFLKAMPKDIQEEIMMSLKNNKNVKKDFFKKTQHLSPDKSVKTKKNESLKEDASEKSDVPEDTFNNYVSLGGLKHLLEEWVSNEETPLDKDLMLIINYLKELITKRYLQELLVILKYFHRFVRSYEKSDQWKKAFLSTLDCVQEKMIEVYKGPLAIEEEYAHF
ncbi:DNA repair protein Rev1 [Halyomorpha halys]|uniref:DNA repair protein Rev1 n=1 Tax=Halyomorpha halys TaxID=286706 RepID=UPI0006D516DA|nr:DNA repair protein REV1 [Halyomorpha halys]